MTATSESMKGTLIDMINDSWPEAAEVLRVYRKAEELRHLQVRPNPGDSFTWVGPRPEDSSAPQVVRLLSRRRSPVESVIVVAVTDHAGVSTLHEQPLTTWYTDYRGPDWVYDTHEVALRAFRVTSELSGDPVQQATSTVLAATAVDAQKCVRGVDQRLRVTSVAQLLGGLVSHEVSLVAAPGTRPQCRTWTHVQSERMARFIEDLAGACLADPEHATQVLLTILLCGKDNLTEAAGELQSITGVLP